MPSSDGVASGTLARIRRSQTHFSAVFMRPRVGMRQVGDTLTLFFESCASGADRMDQEELIRLFSAEQLAVAGARIALSIRDLSAESQPMRIAA